MGLETDRYTSMKTLTLCLMYMYVSQQKKSNMLPHVSMVMMEKYIHKQKY